MKSIKKLGEYEYSEACDRALKIGLFLVVMKFGDLSTVRAWKWRSDYKHHKTS